MLLKKIYSSDGYINEKIVYGSISILATESGRMNSTVTFSGNLTCPVTYHNGLPILKTAVGIMKYYMDGKLYATSKSTDICKYTVDYYLKECHRANLFKIFESNTSSSVTSCKLETPGRALDVPINAKIVAITEIAIDQPTIEDTP